MCLLAVVETSSSRKQTSNCIPVLVYFAVFVNRTFPEKHSQADEKAIKEANICQTFLKLSLYIVRSCFQLRRAEVAEEAPLFLLLVIKHMDIPCKNVYNLKCLRHTHNHREFTKTTPQEKKKINPSNKKHTHKMVLLNSTQWLLQLDILGRLQADVIGVQKVSLLHQVKIRIGSLCSSHIISGA